MATQRWTDKMLDTLASSVSEVKESVSEVKETVTELRESVREVKDTVTEMRKGMDILNVTMQGLLEVVAKQERRMNRFEKEMEERKEEAKRWKREQAETNKRFNVLLGEIRYLIRNIRPEDKSEN